MLTLFRLGYFGKNIGEVGGGRHYVSPLFVVQSQPNWNDGTKSLKSNKTFDETITVTCV